MSDLRFSRWPVDLSFPITWEFGAWGTTSGGAPYQHRGLDLGTPVGTPVYAPADGVVVSHVNDGSYGNTVCLDHRGTGLFSLFAHLKLATVTIGEVVRAGDLLGYTGNTGYTSGAHLHWQVCTNTSFPTNITYSRDPVAFYSEVDDMTRDEVLALLQELGVAGLEDPTGPEDGPRITSPKRLDEYLEEKFRAVQGARTLKQLREALRP